jgi:hypothetical protein
MAKERKRLSLQVIKTVKEKVSIQEKEKKHEDSDIIIEEKPKKVRLKDLEKFSKSVRFPKLWKDEIESNIDYPTDLSSFIVEAIKEKMEREEINTFLG